MSSKNVWSAELYDKNLSFVSEYGKEVVDLLNPVQGEKIFELGCGTGDLTYEISKRGAFVTAMDLSPEMIEASVKKYPEINFLIGNAETFHSEEKYDAVFSNAALHWMKNANQVIKNVWNILNSGGRFVAEFGGQGNVDTIIKGISVLLYQDYGIDASKLNPWFFPSIAEYSTLLEKQGFRVTYAIHFDRFTKMEDGENGLFHWLSGFADDFCKDINDEEKQNLFGKIAEITKNDLFHNGSWYIDYKRIRIVAIKP